MKKEQSNNESHWFSALVKLQNLVDAFSKIAHKTVFQLRENKLFLTATIKFYGSSNSQSVV
jgi:hypothetical protein